MEVEEERKREMGEDELEARVKPEFERKIHRPHIKVDNWREAKQGKKKMKSVFKKEIKSEEF